MADAGTRWNDLKRALSAAGVVCRVAYGLRRYAFPDLLDQLRLRESLSPAAAHCVQQAQTDVRRAHRLIPLEPNCLLDALAAATLVRQQGYSVPLAIGVKMEQGEFQAHAWLGDETEATDGFRLLFRVPNEP